MNRILVLIPLLAFLLVACSMTPMPAPTVAPMTATVPTAAPRPTVMSTPTRSSWQATVDATAVLLLPFDYPPEHLLQEDAVLWGTDFEVNDFFKVLDRLSMRKWYILDYVYWYEYQWGGEPLVYARSLKQQPYRTYSEYAAAEGEVDEGEDMYRFLEYVQVDDSPVGFFQLVVLRIMGWQFYQYQHTAYNDYTIICDHYGLEALWAELEDLDAPIPEDLKERAYALDLEPNVEFSEDTVRVRVVVFTKWGGFLRQAYTIQRKFPHKIIRESQRTLIKYDCGWLY